MTASPLNVDSPSARTPHASRLAYDRSGRGEPMILLHGQGFSRRSFDPVVRRWRRGATSSPSTFPGTAGHRVSLRAPGMHRVTWR